MTTSMTEEDAAAHVESRLKAVQAEAQGSADAEAQYLLHLQTADAVWGVHNYAAFLCVSRKALHHRMNTQQMQRHASAELSLGRCWDAESTANLAWALEASQHRPEDNFTISQAVRRALEVRAECRALRGDLFGAQEDFAALASIGQDTSQARARCQAGIKEAQQAKKKSKGRGGASNGIGKLKAEQSISAQLLDQAVARAQAYRAECLEADATKQQQQNELSRLLASMHATPAVVVASDEMAPGVYSDDSCAADAALQLQDNLPAAAEACDEPAMDGKTSAVAGAIAPVKIASDDHTDRQTAPQTASVSVAFSPSEVATPIEMPTHTHSAPVDVAASVLQSSVPAAAAANPVTTAVCASESHAAGAASALQTKPSATVDNLPMHNKAVVLNLPAPAASHTEALDQLAVPALATPSLDAVQDCVSGKTLPALSKEVAGSTAQQDVHDMRQAASPRIAARHEQTNGVTESSGVTRRLQAASTQTEGRVQLAQMDMGEMAATLQQMLQRTIHLEQEVQQLKQQQQKASRVPRWMIASLRSHLKGVARSKRKKRLTLKQTKSELAKVQRVGLGQASAAREQEVAAGNLQMVLYVPPVMAKDVLLPSPPAFLPWVWMDPETVFVLAGSVFEELRGYATGSPASLSAKSDLESDSEFTEAVQPSASGSPLASPGKDAMAANAQTSAVGAELDTSTSALQQLPVVGPAAMVVEQDLDAETLWEHSTLEACLAALHGLLPNLADVGAGKRLRSLLTLNKQEESNWTMNAANAELHSMNAEQLHQLGRSEAAFDIMGKVLRGLQYQCSSPGARCTAFTCRAAMHVREDQPMEALQDHLEALKAVPTGAALHCALSQLTQWGLNNAALNLAQLVETQLLLDSALHLTGSEVPCCVLQQAAHAHWLTGDAVKAAECLKLLLDSPLTVADAVLEYTSKPNTALLKEHLLGFESWSSTCSLVDIAQQEGDWTSSETLLKQLKQDLPVMLTPPMCARELLYWSRLHLQKVLCANREGQPCAGEHIVRCLAACEWTAAIVPTCWDMVQQVREVQGQALMAVFAKRELGLLADQMLKDPRGLEPPLHARWKEIKTWAGATHPYQGYFDVADLEYVGCNWAQLLSLHWEAATQEVNRAWRKLILLCAPDKASGAHPGLCFGPRSNLEGIGSAQAEFKKASDALPGCSLVLDLVQKASAVMSDPRQRLSAYVGVNLMLSLHRDEAPTAYNRMCWVLPDQSDAASYLRHFEQSHQWRPAAAFHCSQLSGHALDHAQALHDQAQARAAAEAEAQARAQYEAASQHHSWVQSQTLYQGQHQQQQQQQQCYPAEEASADDLCNWHHITDYDDL